MNQRDKYNLFYRRLITYSLRQALYVFHANFACKQIKAKIHFTCIR